jgi:CRISPR-associated protein Cas2
MFVLVSYDVDARRTNTFRRLLKKYLGHEQYSVFFGEIPESTLMKLRGEIKTRLQSGDRILEICARNRHNIDVNQWSVGEANGGAIRGDGRHKSDILVV